VCGRYSLAGSSPGEIRARFPVGESVAIARRYNVAPGDEVLAQDLMDDVVRHRCSFVRESPSYVSWPAGATGSWGWSRAFPRLWAVLVIVAAIVAGIAAGDYATNADANLISGVAPNAYIGNYKALTIPTPGLGPAGNSADSFHPKSLTNCSGGASTSLTSTGL